MAICVATRNSIPDEQTLTTPTATQVYPLGTVLTVDDKANSEEKEYVYLKADGALTANSVYHLAPDTAEIAAKTPATMANVKAVVPESAVTDDYYAWFVQKGTVTLTTAAGETPTAGEYVKWANGVTTIADDGATRTANSIGFAKENIAAATAGSVYLFGENATV